MNRRNTSSSSWMIALAVMVLWAATSTVFAAPIGTPAGTQITNKATVTFSAGAITGRTASATVSCYIGQKIVIGLTPNAATSTVDNITIYEPFTVTNNGNGPDAFTLSIPAAYGTWTASLVESGTTNPIATTGTLLSGDSFSGRIKLDIPASQLNGASQTPTLTVRSTTHSSGVIVVANEDIAQTLVWTVTIAKPVLNFTVTSNPTTDRIPGENQGYTLTITNTGSIATNGTSTVTLLYDNTNFTGAVATDGTNPTASAGTATWTIPILPATTGSAVVHFSAYINQSLNFNSGVAAGTTINTGLAGSKVTYSDGLKTYDFLLAAPVPLVVGTASGVIITRVTADAFTTPGTTIDYSFTVQNMGNHPDNFNITDAFASGAVLSATPVVSTPSAGGTQIVGAQSIAAGATATYWVRYTANAGALDLEQYVRTITAASVSGAPVAIGKGLSQSYTITTIVRAPNLTVSITPSKISGGFANTVTNPVPGDVIEYLVTITNTGSGTATPPLYSVNTGQSPSGTNASLNAHGVDLDPGDNGFAAVDLGKLAGGASLESGVTMTVTTYDIAAGSIMITLDTLPAGRSVKYAYRVTIN